MSKQEKILAELEAIRLANKKRLLMPEEVVAFADQHPDSALHGRFEWDNDQAAHKYRLQQAREIIRYSVTIVRDDKPPINTYFALREDREDGGGYRHVQEIVADEHKYTALLEMAKADMRAFAARYAAISELSGVLHAMRAALEEQTPKRRRKKSA